MQKVTGSTPVSSTKKPDLRPFAGLFYFKSAISFQQL
jgi:hypothetical protein